MGTFKVQGADYSNPVWIAEASSVSIVATPITGYLFDHWVVTGTSSSVESETSSSTTFHMGTENATVTAYFVPALTLTMVPSPTGSGTFKVNSIPYSGPVLIPNNSNNISILATPAAGYVFDHWVVTGTGASVASTTSASTTLTVGAADVTLTAVFLPAKTLTLMSDPASAGAFNVNGAYYDGPVLVGEGTTVTITAFMNTGTTNFLEFVVNSGNVTLSTPTVNGNQVETTFTMGTENVTITARFNQ